MRSRGKLVLVSRDSRGGKVFSGFPKWSPTENQGVSAAFCTLA
jgi:hypothetical protein